MSETAEQRKKREEAEEEERRRRRSRQDADYTAPIYPDPIGSYDSSTTSCPSTPDTGSPPGGCGSDL